MPGRFLLSPSDWCFFVFSATIDFGYKIENGELAYPLRNTMLGINVFDLLHNLDAISSDYREEPGMMMPTIRVQDVKVAGAD